MTLLLLLACAAGTDKSAPPRDRAASDDSGAPDTERETGDTGDGTETATVEDADGDGSPADEDCDDADPDRYPGAEDPCDAIDQDCDGNPAGVGACSELFVVDESTAHGWWVGDGLGGGLSLYSDPWGSWGRPTDFDQDGTIDVVASSRGALLLHGGIPWPDTPVTGVDWLGNWATGTTGLNALGDFDGDGWPDLSVTYTEDGHQELYDGAIYVVLGPPDRWPAYWTDARDVHDGYWTHNQYDEWFGRQTAAADLTDDGLADLVVLSGRATAITGGPQGYLRLLPGRTTGLPTEARIEDEEPWYTVDVSVSWLDQLALLPDIDGDGIPELSFQVEAYDGVGRADTLALVPPDVYTPTYTGQDITDLWVQLDKGDAIQKIEVVPQTNELGDANGDGYGDVLLTVYGTHEAEYVACATVLHGAADLPAHTISDQLGGQLCAADTDFNPVMHVVPDTDGDGVADLFLLDLYRELFDDGAGRRSCVVPAAELPDAGILSFHEARSFCFGSGTEDPYFGGMDMIDLDGDGYSEMIVGDNQWGDDEEGRIFVVPGFEIPWGDPTRW